MRPSDWALAIAFLAALGLAVGVPVYVVQVKAGADDAVGRPGPPDTAVERAAARAALRFAGQVQAGDLLGACRLTAPPAFHRYRCGTGRPSAPDGLRIPRGPRLEAAEATVRGGSAAIVVPVPSVGGHRYQLRSSRGGAWRVTGASAFAEG